MTNQQIEGFVRWAEPTDTWIREERFAEVAAYDGFRLALVDEFKRNQSREWQPDTVARRCRFPVARRGCGRPSVAVLRRGRTLWGYCEQHLYGRHYEDGKLLAAVPVRVDAA